MKAEIVRNARGWKRILLTSETPEERRMIQDIGKLGELTVVVSGKAIEDGQRTAYVSLATADELADEHDSEVQGKAQTT